MTRFWHHAKPKQVDGRWVAPLPITGTDRPLLAYANVAYALEQPVSGAGYYYRTYTADSFNLSSLVSIVWADEVASSGVTATLKPSTIIETFDGDWEREWFTYRPDDWSRTTHKLNDAKYAAPDGAKLAIEVVSDEPNELVLLIDEHAAVISLDGGSTPQQVTLMPNDFTNYAGESFKDWSSAKRLKLSAAEHLRPSRQEQGKPRVVGKHWRGAAPQFRNLCWVDGDET